MDAELQDTLRMLLGGMDTQTRMIARILEIVSAEAAGPSPLMETLRVLVATTHGLQESNSRIENDISEVLSFVRQVDTAIRKPT
jgi:hypothetical protein